jgi:pyridoxine 5-phosphate synthase
VTQFSVNLNKFALIRNSRGTNTPDVAAIARRCIAAGVDGITVHPRPDQRHARYQDVHDLARLVRSRPDARANHPAVELNIEGNPVPAFLDVVLAARPHQCTLVPDTEGQLTSDHGWNVVADRQRLLPVIASLREAGIRTSLFLDPIPEQVAAAKDVGADRIELYTEPYAVAFGTPAQDETLSRFAAAAAQAARLGLGVNAGHDLNQHNLGTFLALVPGVLEVSIGHAVVCDALDHGLEVTLGRYLSIVRGTGAAATAR